MPTRILIADDDPTIRLLLRRLLETRIGRCVVMPATVLKQSKKSSNLIPMWWLWILVCRL